MAKNELDKYIRKSKKGDKEAYRQVIAALYDEIYNLTAFIYEDDETKEKLTKHLFIKCFKNIQDFGTDDCDIHLWMARESTKELYRIVAEREGDIFPGALTQKDYEYESIEQDDEFGEASAEFNEGFLTTDGFDASEDIFASMMTGEKIIYLLYCYEGYTIEEIEDIINIDASFISTDIARLRDGVMAAYERIKAENADSETDALEEEYEKEASGAAGTAEVKEENIYAIGSLRFTEKQFKAVLVGVVAAAAIIVVIAVAAVAVSHRNSSSNAATTKATNATINTPAVQPTSQTSETTEEATEASSEEETTARRVQSGTLPNVEINTTEAPTEPTSAAAVQNTTAATQATTAAQTTTAAETTTAETTAAATTAEPTTAAATTAAQTTTTTAAEPTSSAAASPSTPDASAGSTSDAANSASTVAVP